MRSIRNFWRSLIGSDREKPEVWRAMSVGGGGVFVTPPLLRADAIRYVAMQGSHQMCFVDDSHRIIFYRSTRS